MNDVKSPLKYSVFAVLYYFEEGLWEYEVYEKLKPHYNSRSLSKIRSILLELQNKSWTQELNYEFYEENLLRKFKLQKRHREFIYYQISPIKIINELNLNVENTEREVLTND
ncbi:MAG TPA: hypothetical protein VK121_03040 [Pseudogracilibacillus sp.]|nr:hypothetical protein [Pseudogracilibacillus sp.]